MLLARVIGEEFRVRYRPVVNVNIGSGLSQHQTSEFRSPQLQLTTRQLGVIHSKERTSGCKVDDLMTGVEEFVDLRYARRYGLSSRVIGARRCADGSVDIDAVDQRCSPTDGVNW